MKASFSDTAGASVDKSQTYLNLSLFFTDNNTNNK